MHVNFACKYNSFTESQSSERKKKSFKLRKNNAQYSLKRPNICISLLVTQYQPSS